jgi:hypothetical protein
MESLSIVVPGDPVKPCEWFRITIGNRGGGMARMEDWQRDVDDGLRRENWSLKGPKRIVKVRPGGEKTLPALGGYITSGIFLSGKTPLQIEQTLGLPQGYLTSGARIYRFIRLPMIHEYEYELTAHYPGGLAFNPASSNPAFPPGSAHVHQWRIKDGIQLPVDLRNILNLMPGQRFPYEWLLT